MDAKRATNDNQWRGDLYGVGFWESIAGADSKDKNVTVEGV